MVKKPREMNKTEEEFSRILEAKVKRGELSEFRYEGMKLAWSGMLYTPDFCAWDHLGALTFYEVKGAHIFSRDIVRFKGCRAQWPRYQFEMWQKSKREWRQIL